MKKTVTIISVIAVVIIYFFAVGINIDIEGLVCINTKYYNSAEKAFFAGYSGGGVFDTDIESFSETDIVVVDEYNAFFTGFFDDTYLLLAHMKINNNKFYFGGDYVIYDLTENLSQFCPESFSRIASNFRYSGYIECDVVMDNFSDIKDKYQKKSIEIKSLPEPCCFVYNIVS